MPRRDPDDTDVAGWDLDQLAAYRRKLAKRANQRIVRLEQAGYNPKATALENYAYKYLQRTGRNRFAENKKPLSAANAAAQYHRERAEIAQLERFLQSKTSTVGGVKETQNRVKRTFKDKYGIDMNNKTVDAIMRNHFKFLVHSVGSDVAVSILKAVNASNSTFDEIMSKFAKLEERDRTTLKDMPVEDVFKKLDLPFNSNYLRRAAPDDNPFV